MTDCKNDTDMVPKIVVLDGYALNPGDILWDDLQALGNCVIYDRTLPDELMARAEDAEVLMTNKTVLTAEHILGLPRLKYIGVMATGYNIVDIDAARRQGVVVTNIPSYSTSSVAQMTFAHILNITQQADYYSRQVHQGRWTNCEDFTFRDTPLIELAGLKIGIIGLGNIGRAVAHIARGFEMEVHAFTSKAREELPEWIVSESLDDIFACCDIISLHVPLTPETKHLVNAHRLGLMKRNAILINTGRGPLVNEQDLANALNHDRIYAAGLDVLSTEPPQADNPLLTAKNCFITPHISWATLAARRRLMKILVDNLQAYIAGKVVNNVV